jgi:hypothetical protein
VIVAVVQIPMARRSRAAAVASAEKTAPTYAGLAGKGLLRKYYLNGDAGGGGVYFWSSLDEAKAWYTPEWEARVAAQFGAKPVVTYYENYVVVDNERHEVRIERE